MEKSIGKHPVDRLTPPRPHTDYTKLVISDITDTIMLTFVRLV